MRVAPMRRLPPAVMSAAAGGTSLVGEIASTGDWQGDAAFLPLDIACSIDSVATIIGLEEVATTTDLTGAIGGAATIVGTLSEDFPGGTILAYIDAALLSLVTVRAEKLAVLVAARIAGVRADIDAAGAQLQYVDQAIRELNHSRPMVVQYEARTS